MPISAQRDANFVPAIIGVSSVDLLTPTAIKVNPSTGALLIDAASIETALDTRYLLRGGDSTSGNYTFSGHLTIEGVTTTGAQGTGNLVFATSPTITTPTIAGNLAVSNGYTYDIGTAGIPWNNGWFGFSVNIQNSGINTEIIAGANGTNQILTLPLGTDTIIARNSTDTLTNKTLTAPIINGIIKPSADSTTAIQIDKANGSTNVFNVDTTNSRIGINTTSPPHELAVNGDISFPYGNSFIATNGGSTDFPNKRILQVTFTNGGDQLDLYTPGNSSGNSAMSLNSSGFVSLNYNARLVGPITKYNNISTAGNGVPSIYGQGRSTGQTGAVASVATYTVGSSDGSFIVSANANITTFVAGTFNVTVSYTDETNTAQTLKLNFSTLTGTLGVALAASGPFEGIPAHIRCKASTTITVATSGTFTSLTYNVEAIIQQLA